MAVVSTGRRNTLAKSLCWRLEVQRFPGPLVELARHLVQLGLGVRREIKALGEVLAQQAIAAYTDEKQKRQCKSSFRADWVTCLVLADFHDPP